MKSIRYCIGASILATLCVACGAPDRGTTVDPAEQQIETRRLLSDGWAIRASADLAVATEAGGLGAGGSGAEGAEISSADFRTEGWHPTSVPTTILAALVADGVYTDPYFGNNLEKIPTEQFEGSWWYRTSFELDALSDGLSLVFDGINFRADVWLNGQQLGDTLVGSYRVFEVDIRAAAKVGTNVLAVEVHPPQAGDFTIGFVDWNPVPPDRNMGLWRQVWLRTTGAISVDHAVVDSAIAVAEGGAATSADLKLGATVRNNTSEAVSGTLVAEISAEGLSTRRIEHAIELAAGEERRLALGKADHPELHLESARLWWPHTLGEPHLYELDLSVKVGEEVSDRDAFHFGVREVSDYMNAQGHRGYTVNGKEVLIRGGGWVDDLMLADTERTIEAQMEYTKHMGLETVRLEGFWGSSQYLYDTADRLGLLLMPGFSCQWEWVEYLGKEVDETYGGVQTEEDIAIVVDYLRDQATWLRRHPSIFVWVLASDMLPKPELESGYIEVMKEVDTTRPLLAACSVRTSEVSGPTGVKMNGPYDYVTPNYWYVDEERGGAYGFNTETGPGPQPPPIESLRRMLPEESLWPIDEMWDYHSGRHQFQTIDNYTKALDARYGPSDDVETFSRKAQVANYEAMRAMFEAFALRRPETTGLVQWMLNSAWPELYWQLYDHYLLPNGAFYGALRATADDNLIYDYGDGTVWAVRGDGAVGESSALEAEIRLFGPDSQPIHEEKLTVEGDWQYAKKLLSLEEHRAKAPLSFLDLRLRTPQGEEVGRNFYWLSAKDDVLDPDNSEWYITPNSSYADYTALDDLPRATLEVSIEGSGPVPASEARGTGIGDRQLRVRLVNPGEHLVFFTELRVVDRESNRSLLPVFFDDNYISVLPGEERVISVQYTSDGVDADRVALRYSGPNIEAGEILLPSS